MANLNSHTVTIANGQSLSSAVDLRQHLDEVPVALRMPSAWDAADLTFQGSEDGTNFANLYLSAGSELLVEAAASRYIALDPSDFIGMRYLKVRSGTSGTPVNQTAERQIILVTKQIS